MTNLPYTNMIRDKIIKEIEKTEIANSNSDQAVPSIEFFTGADLMKKEIIKNVQKANLS